MYLILTASPNSDGLTAASAYAALQGIQTSGGEGEIVDLFTDIARGCLACENGWGKCIKENKCVIDDGLVNLQNRLKDSEGIFLITPVYFGGQSERMRYFTDRLRRCEAFRKEKSILTGKKINLVAAAGGTGNGTAPCLVELETWCRHVGAIPNERVGITQSNRKTMLEAIEHAGATMVIVDKE